MSVDDKYTYPGSGGVLVNKLGIRDAARLDEALNDYASIEWAAIISEPLPERPDFGYLRSVHERLFDRVLPFAGEIRDVDAQATGVGMAYCRPEFIGNAVDDLFDKLAAEDYLTNLDARSFADRLADRWGELTAIHPFRDGNTRSQSAYVSIVAERAGHPIDWQRIDVDELRRLRLHAMAGRDNLLAEYLHSRLLSHELERAVPTASRSPFFVRPQQQSRSDQVEWPSRERAPWPSQRDAGEWER